MVASDSGGASGTTAEARHQASLPGQQARLLTFSVLSEPNRIARLRQLCELLERVDKDNWHDVVDAFVVQTAKEGRVHDTEWNTLMERIGEVDGLQAITQHLSSGNKDPYPLRSYMTGWAGTDPSAATAWFQEQDAATRKQLTQPFLDGLSRTDPARALAIAMQLPGENQAELTSMIAGNAVQRGGFREGEALLATLLGRADVTDATRSAMFSVLAKRKIHMAGVIPNPVETLDWFAKYVAGPTPPANPAAAREIFNAAARRNPEATLNWLEQNGKMGAEISEAAYLSVGQAMYGQDAKRFVEWADSHRDHPQCETMVAEAVRLSAFSGRIEEAQQWAARVQSPERRAQLEGLISIRQRQLQSAKPAGSR